MARPLRLAMPDTFYHVLSRGNERRDIFDDARDYEKFLGLLATLSDRFEIDIWSYVLMGNHYHLLLKTPQPNLSEAMQWLGVSYSSYYNWRNDRSGHLFQARFKSFVVEGESYLQRLILYIHRNPLRARMVERLADYAWSSYPCLAYGRKCEKWLQREKVLSLFGEEQKDFRQQVQDYSEEQENLLENLREGFFLGAETALEKLKAKWTGSEEQEKPATRVLTRIDIQEIEARFQEILGLPPEEIADLRVPRRKFHRPLRDVLIYLVWKRSGLDLRTIGAHFGVGYSSVSHARRRGEDALSKNAKLRKTVAPLL